MDARLEHGYYASSKRKHDYASASLICVEEKVE
jgi:hypothetical protein